MVDVKAENMKPSTLIIGGMVLGGLFLASEAAAWQRFNSHAAPWRNTINRESARYGVNRHIVAAIINRETGGSFNPGLVGKLGEIGLGQTLPGAWADLQTRYAEFKDRDYGDTLTDPNWQIRATAAYYAIQRKRMGNTYDALRAYNGGAAGAAKKPELSVDYALAVIKTALVDMLLSMLDTGGVNG